jgi:hypothetical protein
MITPQGSERYPPLRMGWGWEGFRPSPVHRGKQMEARLAFVSCDFMSRHSLEGAQASSPIGTSWKTHKKAAETQGSTTTLQSRAKQRQTDAKGSRVENGETFSPHLSLARRVETLHLFNLEVFLHSPLTSCFASSPLASPWT